MQEYQTEEGSKMNLDSHANEEEMLEQPPPPIVEERIVPISGNPFFTSVLTKTHCQVPYRAMIPKRFYHFLPPSTATVSVFFQNRTWDMRYYGNIAHRRFCAGWKNFVLDNDLKIGDACVFELLDSNNLIFKVQVLRGGIPFLMDGESTDTPILID